MAARYTTKTSKTMGAAWTMKSTKFRLAALPMRMFGGSPISVAGGELTDFSPATAAEFIAAVAGHVEFIKFGLAGCGRLPDWPRWWRAAASAFGGRVQPVAVVYADWRAAAAPSPQEVFDLAVAEGAAAVLADTWDKSGGNLFDYWDEVAVERFCRRVQQGGRRVALAGSLSGASLTAAARCRPDLVAVRAAACDGGRLGGVAASRVSAIRRQFESARSQSQPAAVAGEVGASASDTAFEPAPNH